MKIPTIPIPVRPGVMREVLANPSGFLLKLARATGDIGEYRAGPVHIVCVNAPALIHEVLVTQARAFTKMDAVRTLRAFTGDGLLVNEGAVWEKHRKLAAPAFHHARIAAYQRTIAALTDEMQAGWTDGQRIDLSAEIVRLTLRVIARTLFDLDLSNIYAGFAHDIELAMAYVNTLSARGAFPGGTLFVRGRRQALAAIARIDGFVRVLIRERRADPRDRGDLLSMLLLARTAEGEGLDDDEVRDESITVFVAGHETIAAALAWSLLLLDQHPDAQAGIAAEARQACGDGLPTGSQLVALPYALQVFKESMRLYPPAFVVGRQTTQAVSLQSHQIPRGAWVMVSPAVVHLRPEVFDDPARFDPARFLPEREKALPRGAYIPFGWGARICIGNMFALMEGQTILATLAPRVRLKIEGGTPGAAPMITLNPDRRLFARVGRL